MAPRMTKTIPTRLRGAVRSRAIISAVVVFLAILAPGTSRPVGVGLLRVPFGNQYSPSSFCRYSPRPVARRIVAILVALIFVTTIASTAA